MDIDQNLISIQNKQLGELAKALSAAQGELSTAKKTSTNPHFKSKFADLSEVWDACRAALSKHKIAVIQCPQFDEKCDYLETTLVHESGQYITSRMVLKNAKGDMQGLGSSISYAKRYSLAAMVGVVSGDEDDDGNAASFKDVSPAIKQATAVPVPGFDPNNKLHRDKLAAECLKRKIFGDHQNNLFAAMKGKPFSELEKLITLTNPESAGEL